VGARPERLALGECLLQEQHGLLPPPRLRGDACTKEGVVASQARFGQPGQPPGDPLRFRPIPPLDVQDAEGALDG